MITSIKLRNFRRHADTELRLHSDHQIILVSGRNGVGKSTLLEAITFALYGQGRNGRFNLDRLVRRGAELEGMEVDIDFEVGGTSYRVERKRDSGVSSAVLYGNDVPLMRGSDAVSAEITKILGMDVVGFRLAVIAQQKELDGLASVQPAKRAEMLSRLLRLDAISKAKLAARASFASKREVLLALGPGADLPTLRGELAQAEGTLAGANEALAACAGTLAQLQSQLAGSEAVEKAWTMAQHALAVATGRRDEALGEVGRLSAELSALPSPVAPVEPVRSIADLSARSVSLERAIAEGLSTQRLVEQRSMVEAELAIAKDRLCAVEADLNGISAVSLAAEVVTSEADLASMGEHISELLGKLAALREEHGAAKALVEVRKEAVARADRLSGTCETCGQPISGDHRLAQLRAANDALGEAEAVAAAKLSEGRAVRSELAEAEEARNKASYALDRTRAMAAKARSDEEDRAELTRRVNAYTQQLDRLPTSSVDMEELYVKRADLAVEIELARQADIARRDYEATMVRKSALELSLQGAVSRAAAAEESLAAAAIGDDLRLSYEAREQLREQLSGETELYGALLAEQAVATERVAVAGAAITRAEAAIADRRRREAEADAVANAARVLEALESKLKASVKPALEAAVSDVLALLSEGRYGSVRFDSHYNISLLDDGRYHPISEFSGGEADLIALAVRVAISQVVSERHASDGLGLLIFDEIFGSQDNGRRQSIMNALRALRGTYSQILLISHVGGLEDEADSVIELDSVVDDDGNLIARAA